MGVVNERAKRRANATASSWGCCPIGSWWSTRANRAGFTRRKTARGLGDCLLLESQSSASNAGQKGQAVKLGMRVVKAGSPGIQGTVVSQQGAKVRVRWSEHCASLVDPRKLIQVTQTTRKEATQ